ncbi:MAG: hypothetical protein AAGH89_07895, partial [Verrucomicrobiota bacterium]
MKGFRKLGLTFALLATTMQAQTFVPVESSAYDEALIPAALGLRTDQQGSSWNFQQNGTLGRIG